MIIQLPTVVRFWSVEFDVRLDYIGLEQPPIMLISLRIADSCRNGHLAYHFFVLVDNRPVIASSGSGDASQSSAVDIRAEQRGILILKESRLAELLLFAVSSCNRRENSHFSSCWQSRGMWYLKREIPLCFFKRSCYAACCENKENRRISSR